jgi:hypothetical protein
MSFLPFLLIAGVGAFLIYAFPRRANRGPHRRRSSGGADGGDATTVSGGDSGGWNADGAGHESHGAMSGHNAGHAFGGHDGGAHGGGDAGGSDGGGGDGGGGGGGGD